MTDSATPLPIAGHSGGTRVRFRILGILVALSFVGYLLRTNMSVAGESIQRELGLTNVQLGYVLGAFAWGYAIFQFPGGLFGLRFGGRRTLTWTALLWGAVTIATGLVPGGELALPVSATLALLVALRFAMGVLQAPLFPVIGGLFGKWFPVSGWGLPNGLSSSGLTLGAAAAGPLIAWLSQTVGWRSSFLLVSPLAFVAAAWWWRSGRDRPSEHPDVGADELALVRPPYSGGHSAGRGPELPIAPGAVPPAEWGAVPPAEWGAVPPAEWGAWRIVLRDKNVLLLTASYFCSNYLFYIFFNWFFLYLVRERNFGELESGFLATLPWLVGAVAAALGGIWCDRLSRARGIRLGCRVPCLTGLLAGAVLLWAGAGMENASGAVVLLGLCFGCVQLTEGAYWSATTSVAGRHTAAASGLLNTGGNVVGGVGALLVPVLAERFGWYVAFASGSLFALVGAVLWLFIRADEPLAD